MIIADAAGHPVHLGQDDARSRPRTSTGSRTATTPRSGPQLHVAEVGVTARPTDADRPPPRTAGGGAPSLSRDPLACSAYIVRRLLWMVVLLLRDQLHHVRDLLRAARGRPGACCAPGAARRPELVARDPRSSSASTSRWYVAVLALPQAPRLPLRLRLQLPEQRRRSAADLRPRCPNTLFLVARRRGHLAARSASRSASSRAIKRGTLLRPRRRWAARWSRSRRRSTGSASSRCTCSPTTSASSHDLRRAPAPTGRRARPLRRRLHGADPAVARARRRRSPRSTRGFLRGNLIETMPRTTSAPRGPRACASARVIFRHGVRSAITPIVTHARPRHRHPARRRDPHRDRLQHPRHRPPRLRRDPAAATCRSIQGTVLVRRVLHRRCMNLIVDILYAFLDPRVRY